jgi:hypothetical protein
LSEHVDSVYASRVVSDELDLGLPAVMLSLMASAPFVDLRPEAIVYEIVRSRAELGATEALAIARPEVVFTHLPSMVRIAAPQPGIPIYKGSKLSTAGVFCRDPEGYLGVTACLHGAGPVGTKITVSGVNSAVALVSEVQDLVFIPLNEQLVPAAVRGAAGLRAEAHLPPAQGERAWFDGAVTNGQETIIDGTDRLLFRWSPTKQLRIQTRRDTDHGESGSALIDADDRILGFAFEMTGHGEYPQFTDWIWAPNALRALGLQPIVPG